MEVCIDVVTLECFGCAKEYSGHVTNFNYSLHGLVTLRANITKLTYCIAYGAYMLRIRINQPLA